MFSSVRIQKNTSELSTVPVKRSRNRRRCRALLMIGLAVGAAARAHGDEPSLDVSHASQTLGESYRLGDGKPAPGISLDELTAQALAQNPRLAQAQFAYQSAQGRALQAGLYPNPIVNLTWDELGDRTGPSGVNTLPLVTQEIVLGKKLQLSRNAGQREADQASWRVMAERYALLAKVRAAYFDAVTLQSRIEILEEILGVAEKSLKQTDSLLQAKLVARLDLVQMEVETERLRADLESANRELPSAYKRLAASVGNQAMSIQRVAGTLDVPLPDYDLERAREYVLTRHPQLEAARYGVERARLLVKRAEVEPIPNLNVGAGYVRQNQNRSDDYVLSATMTIPLWNRNQGNIHAAEAEYCAATQEVRRVENDLTEDVATSMRDFASARVRAQRYRERILPRAQETYQLSLDAYQGGEFEYLRVLEAQRALAQANLEYVRALGDAWRAASAISGLTMEDEWPPPQAQVPPAPAANPES